MNIIEFTMNQIAKDVVNDEVVVVETAEKVEKLEAEGYHVVTDSDLNAGGEVWQNE